MSRGYEDEYDDQDDRPDDRGDDDYDRRDRGDRGTRDAKQRVNVPGILLIVLGVLNALGGGYLLLNGIVAMSPAGKEIAKAQAEAMNPQQQKQAEQAGFNMDKLISGFAVGYAIIGGLGILVAILTVVAGVMIRNLRGFALGVICAILACIPALSFFGCCAFGQVVGIWTLVVLFNADVKAAFR